MEYKQIAEYIVNNALLKGADAADVVISSSTQSTVEVRLGKIDKLQQSSPKALGIRIFKNNKSALTYTSDFRTESIDDLIKRTIEIAAVTGEDALSGLPEKSLQGKADASLKIFDESVASIPTDKKIQLAKEVEKIGMAQDKRITNSDGASWSDAVSTFILANSNGFYGEQKYTRCSLNCALMAEEDGVRQRDYWGSTKRYFNKLEDAESIGKKAAERTVRKLGAVKPETCNVPVVFDPAVGRDFLDIISSVILGTAIYRNQSFLLDKLGETVAVESMNLVDDGLLADGLGSRLFDDEGLPSRLNKVIENGVLKTYLLDTYSAKKLNMKPTGSANRGVSSKPSPGTSNFYMAKGTTSPEDIIASVKDGLYLTDVHWTGINYITGDYSRGAEGIWIKDGKLTHPVQEFTVASNMLDMMKNIEVIGNDLEFRGGTNAPTFKIAEMTISGK